ncbi:hypothetical protein FANTH_6846 [Fusarium anthophilum]|uniref:Aminotransferase class I/classII domain-containing protein n=1 Tax=Fusarium anthophilum TaxID=48485 RepID=A0A8H4ZH91_9HYPO|nr:hypothetical protein FANTH_6846 [Fusarium anthophilum]
MSPELMPSSRAQAALHQDPVGALMEEVKLKPQYHPTLRPNGILNLSGALNSLMTDWMAEYCEKEPLSMSECLSYGPLIGSPDLLAAAASFFNRFFSPSEPVHPEHVLAANGVTSLMDMVAWTLCDPGQGVLYLTPNFFMLSYDMTIRAGLATIPISTAELSDPFGSNNLPELIRALDIASSSALEDRGIECRVVFLCNPTNPQGRCYSPQMLEGLASWCVENKMQLVVDEIYAMSTLTDNNNNDDDGDITPFTSILSITSQQNVHCLYGMSKDFNMGGLRMGFLVTRNPLIRAAASQAAWFTWLTVASDKFVTRFLQQLDMVQDYLGNNCSRLTEAYRRTTTALNKYRIPFQRADAGLFVFIDLSRWVHNFEAGKTGSPEMQLCRMLIDNGVFLNPGQIHNIEIISLTDNTNTQDTMQPHLAYRTPEPQHDNRPSMGYHYPSTQCSTLSSLDTTAEDWTPVDAPHPSPVSQHSHVMPASLAGLAVEDELSLVCIFAKCLIPGRSEPLHNVAVGVCVDTGKITYAGPQTQLPKALQSVPRVQVGYLMPGLWDCHTHFAGILDVDFPSFVLTHPVTSGAAITRDMHETLMAGFTSVRDVGSYATEVAPLVEKGLILGPNIFGAGAAIGITSGSCDACTLPADYVYSRQGGGGGGSATQDFWPGVSILAIADGVDECRRAVRQQIRRGASCIKIVTTGGILSRTDDPHCRQYSDAELDVMIEEASLHNRAVAAHAHGKAGIMAAVKAGAHTIEHGSYLDDEAAELMVKHNTTFISTRYVLEANLKQLDTLNPETAEKMIGVAKVHLEAYRTAVRHGVKIALGTDIAGSDPTSLTVHGKNGHEVALAVKAGLTPLQAIDAGTINSAETLGRLTPQKGLVRVGWDADLIALDEDPLENISLFDNAKNIKFVWKGGMLVKSPTGQMIWPPKRKSYK